MVPPRQNPGLHVRNPEVVVEHLVQIVRAFESVLVVAKIDVPFEAPENVQSKNEESLGRVTASHLPQSEVDAEYLRYHHQPGSGFDRRAKQKSVKRAIGCRDGDLLIHTQPSIQSRQTDEFTRDAATP
jgi:hypothetical protein